MSPGWRIVPKRTGAPNACKHKRQGQGQQRHAMFALRRALRPLNVAAAGLTTLQLTKCDEKKAPPSASTSHHRAAASRPQEWQGRDLGDAEGMRTTPSYVAAQRATSDSSATPPRRPARNAEGTICERERLIGRLASDSTVKADLKRWPFDVVAGEGGKAMIRADEHRRARTLHPRGVRLLSYQSSRRTRRARW